MSNQLAQIKRNGGFVAATDEALEALKTAKPADISISEQYFEFVPKGEKVRGFFIGNGTHEVSATIIDKDTGEVTTTIKRLPCVKFLTPDRRIYRNSALKFVEALSDLPEFSGFEAQCTGTKTTQSGGKMQLFDVFPIPL